MTVPVGAAGVRGLGGRGYLAYAATGGVGGVGRMAAPGGVLGAAYGLKPEKRAEDKLYDLLPGMELTPLNPSAMGLKLPEIKHPPQVSGHAPGERWHPIGRRQSRSFRGDTE